MKIKTRKPAWVVERIMRSTHIGENCWEWQGALDRSGYGKTCNHGRIEFIHRVIYSHLVGDIKDGYFICHHCDNPKCVRPSHLFAGTPKDNIHDMIRKNRHWKSDIKGERVHLAKLTENKVRQIRSKYETQKITQAELAKEYGVTQGTIHFIIYRKTWRHVS